ncbi:maleylpyruvate isomerase family mycothiol-dependent enzyme [Gordonia humi]|uniref:Uncharacterized protein (TIGR03086 family) n=1 Tax=Gordonia humi TaxID=686429 RepID=A0A840FC89_9ACTN|nr:maleylpyruvate isomerase family mycothiol-dependent enzyme [Gordonia humi]MBB4137730.1 uncharacterized protein (TIGR03086 family) [Gordonia humi]
MSALTEATPAERHRIVASGFAEQVAATADWSARSPVPEWTARDVVGHLTGWLPEFLAAGGVALRSVTSVDEAPTTAWTEHAAAVQELFDADDADREFTHPYLGTSSLESTIDRIYTADVFMHTWDLARAGARRPDLDPEFATVLLDGLRQMEGVLRSSGQYGPAHAVPGDADPVVALAAFIGRDPNF